jgi:uncharacterized protein
MKRGVEPGLEITTRPDLEVRLAARRAIEAGHHKGRRAHGHGDFMLAHDRVAGFVLRTILLVTGLYHRGVANALRLELRHLRLEFTDLPPSLTGFRILHLADLHIDGVDGLTEILVEQLAGLPVDLCVLTGDYRFEVYGPCHRVYPRMRQVLSAIQARYGVVGILGNHDCADIAVELEKAGVRMLINEAVAAGPDDDSLWIIGVDDAHYYGCDDLAQALEGVPGDAFRLLLAHTPEMFDEAAKAGIDLYLTGHTHGGQICLPWIGPLVINAACPREYTRGHWQHGAMQGYTSTGAGSSMLPVRFGCPPEITVIELVQSQTS